VANYLLNRFTYEKESYASNHNMQSVQMIV